MHALENNKIDLISWPETHQAILAVFHQTKHLEASWICGWTTRRKGPPKKSRIHICCISLPLFLTIHKLAGVWLVPLPPGFFFFSSCKGDLKMNGSDGDDEAPKNKKTVLLANFLNQLQTRKGAPEDRSGRKGPTFFVTTILRRWPVALPLAPTQETSRKMN